MSKKKSSKKKVSKKELSDILDDTAKAVYGGESKKAKKAKKDKVVGFASDGLIHDSRTLKRVPTGCFILDQYLRGGIPLGRLTEIFGDPSKGKSTLLAHIYAQVQKMGGVAMHLLSEADLDSDRWERIGVDVDDMMVVPIEIMENGFKAVRHAANKAGGLDVPCIIGWDTLTGTLTENEYESLTKKDAKYNNGMMNKYKIIRRDLGRIKHELPKNKCGLIVVQQSISSPNPYQKKESGGGGGVKFYSDLRLYLSVGRKAQLFDGSRGIESKIEDFILPMRN